VDLVEGIGERRHQHIHGGNIVEPRTPAHGFEPVGRTAHALGSAPNGRIGIAMCNGVGSRYNGLQTAAAYAIEREGRRSFRKSPAQRGHARQIHVFGVGVDHVAENHMANVAAGEAGAADALAHNSGGEFSGRNVLQRAAEFADGVANCAQNHNLPISHATVPFLHCVNDEWIDLGLDKSRGRLAEAEAMPAKTSSPSARNTLEETVM
jgi:hypothetical protein